MLVETLAADCPIKLGNVTKRHGSRWAPFGNLRVKGENEAAYAARMGGGQVFAGRLPENGEPKPSEIFAVTRVESNEEEILQGIQKRLVLPIRRDRKDADRDATRRLA